MKILKNIHWCISFKFHQLFFNFHTTVKENNNFRYPFLIMSTDRADEKDTHWQSFFKFIQKLSLFYTIVLDLME